MFKHGDPEEIRYFAKLLRVFSHETRDQLHGLRSHLREMANTSWRDNNQRVYEQDFEETAEFLFRSLEEFASEQSVKLERLATQYDDVEYG